MDDGDEAHQVDEAGDEVHYVMPFVVCEPDGPYDLEAYEAGWEMGTLAARLAAAEFHELGLPAVTIRKPNLPQVDLLAMAHGATAYVVPWAAETDERVQDQWAYVQFVWDDALPDALDGTE